MNLFTKPTSDPPSDTAAELPPARKFMFDYSFDHGGSARPPERKPVTLKPEQVDALKKESYDLGFSAGQKAGVDQQKNQLITLCARLDEHLTRVISTFGQIERQKDADMRALSLAMIQKILPNLIQKMGTHEVESLVGATISEMIHESRLVIRVNDQQYEELKSTLQEIATQKAYAGELVILSSSEIHQGDCQIEWADGGLERNTDTMMQNLANIVHPVDNNGS